MRSPDTTFFFLVILRTEGHRGVFLERKQDKQSENETCAGLCAEHKRLACL